MAEPVPIRVALAQINATVGDVEGNEQLIAGQIERARDAGADLVVLPELCLSGYPPEDLLFRADFLDACSEALESLKAASEGVIALVGFPERVAETHKPTPDPINDPHEPSAHNSLAVLADGELAGTYRKSHLPNYGVFDENRYFVPGGEAAMVGLDEALVGLSVCEDIWVPGFPEAEEAAAGARLIVNSTASPYARGKADARERMVAERARANDAAFALCNTVGGQDELIFDGRSVVVAPDGRLLARAAQFEPELLICDLLVPGAGESADGPVRLLARRTRAGGAPPGPTGNNVAGVSGLTEEVYRALVLGVRDYAEKNGFEAVVLGLSGGIDSALVAMIAADALGPERVTCAVMPSPHSSEATQSDARAIARNLGANLIELPIDEPMEAFEGTLAEPFSGTEPGLAEENLQARIRGTLLMALSNKFGWLVLTTGNKSELAVGYATLYGDMAGGFAVIKDVLKTRVYELVRARNERAGRELVPSSVIERPPTAELRPGQLDEDSLPPYSELDRVLEAYVEGDQGRERMVSEGLPEEVVTEVIRLVDRAEYKRRQAPPGPRISGKAFGRDRRLPITNRFRAVGPKLPR